MDDVMLLVGDSHSNLNLYYKTRFLAGDPFVYAERNGTGILVVNSMERGRAEKESIVPTVKTFDQYDLWGLARGTGDRFRAFGGMLARIVEELGGGPVSVEHTFPILYGDVLREHGLQVSIQTELLTDQRRCKTAAEIAAIEEAQRATERAVHHAIEIVRASEILSGTLHFNGIPLTSERLRGEIEAELARSGMDTSDGMVVAAGPGAADPHFEGAGPIRPGEAIVLDVFPRSRRTHYWADMTRTVVKGDPSPLLRAMYDAVLNAQETALGLIRPGALGSDIHAAVEAVFAAAGFAGSGGGPRYIHGTGHGVGLEIHEAPNLGLVGGELRVGDVVSVEPGLYDPEIGGIRIEDLVVVTEAGYRNLTDFPKTFEL